MYTSGTMITLNIKKRDTGTSPEDVRKAGDIPAVFYGPKEESTSIAVNAVEFEKVYAEAGESTIITLKGDAEDHDALVHDVQVDPVKGTILHVDLYVIERGKKLTLHVPVEFEGTAPAEKTLGGVLVKVMHEIEIEAMPRHLPQHLTADLSVLVDFDTVLHAKDLALPEGVELVTEPEEVVALVQEHKEEEESEAFNPESVQVEEKGKKEEESAEEK